MDFRSFEYWFKNSFVKTLEGALINGEEKPPTALTLFKRRFNTSIDKVSSYILQQIVFKQMELAIVYNNRYLLMDGVNMIFEYKISTNRFSDRNRLYEVAIENNNSEAIEILHRNMISFYKFQTIIFYARVELCKDFVNMIKLLLVTGMPFYPHIFNAAVKTGNVSNLQEMLELYRRSRNNNNIAHEYFENEVWKDNLIKIAKTSSDKKMLEIAQIITSKA